MCINRLKVYCVLFECVLNLVLPCMWLQYMWLFGRIFPIRCFCRDYFVGCCIIEIFMITSFFLSPAPVSCRYWSMFMSFVIQFLSICHSSENFINPFDSRLALCHFILLDSLVKIYNDCKIFK